MGRDTLSNNARDGNLEIRRNTMKKRKGLAQQVLQGSHELDRMREEIQTIICILASWVPNLSVGSAKINKDWDLGHFWSIQSCQINLRTRVGLEFNFQKVFDKAAGHTIVLYSTLRPESIKVEHLILIHGNLHRLVELVLTTFPQIKQKPEVKAILEAGELPDD